MNTIKTRLLGLALAAITLAACENADNTDDLAEVEGYGAASYGTRVEVHTVAATYKLDLSALADSVSYVEPVSDGCRK